MASLPTRTTASFDAIKPVSSLVLLDNEFNQYVGASGIFNGGTTATKLLVKASDATDPPIAVDQIGAGLILQGKQNGVEKFRIENDGDLVANGITGAAGIYTFANIPLGPASDPTTANQLTRKSYVDLKQTRWTANFFIGDPSTYPLNSFDGTQQARVPGANFTVRWMSAVWATGSASGSFTIAFRRRAFGAGESGDLASITFNSGTAFSDVEVDFGPLALNDNDSLFIKLTARSSPLQRNVSISLKGWQTPA